MLTRSLEPVNRPIVATQCHDLEEGCASYTHRNDHLDKRLGRTYDEAPWL